MPSGENRRRTIRNTATVGAPPDDYNPHGGGQGLGQQRRETSEHLEGIEQAPIEAERWQTRLHLFEAHAQLFEDARGVVNAEPYRRFKPRQHECQRIADPALRGCGILHGAVVDRGFEPL